ncbi:MAG: hypothetical protein ACRBEE_15920 [Arenicella sp.]
MQRLLIILLSCLTITACSNDPTSPEQQVRNSLSAMEEAAQERSTSDFMKYISDDYSDLHGNNKDDLKRLVQVLFLRNQKIHIFTAVRSLELNYGFAKVEVSAAMTSREVDLSQEKNRLKADTQRFSLTLIPKKNSDIWLVKSAEWQRGW